MSGTVHSAIRLGWRSDNVVFRSGVCGCSGGGGSSNSSSSSSSGSNSNSKIFVIVFIPLMFNKCHLL